MEDNQEVHKYIILVLTTAIGSLTFFLKRVINKVDKVEDSLAKHKENDIEKYVTKDEMRRNSDEYRAFLEAVISPLNRKLESIEEHIRGAK